MALGSRPHEAAQSGRVRLCRLRAEPPHVVPAAGPLSRERDGRRAGQRLVAATVARSRARGRDGPLCGGPFRRSRSTLAAAILLGAREQLDPERNEGFLVTGTIHVLSISGLHVGILAWGFWVVLRTGLLPQRPAIIAAMLLTVAYAFLTDLQPPVVRATVLVVVLCLAKLAGRHAFGFNPLALAASSCSPCSRPACFWPGRSFRFWRWPSMILFAPVLLPQPIVDPLDRLIAATRPWPVRWMRCARRQRVARLADRGARSGSCRCRSSGSSTTCSRRWP